ncbi:unnamed protein product, partial [marine sediment metagenome]
MSGYHQAKWDEPIIFEIGRAGRRGFKLSKLDKTIASGEGIVETHRRKRALKLPQLSEVEIVRHYTRLSEMSVGIDTLFYPLGSCTMKYNPKINDLISSLSEVSSVHPDQDSSTIQGSLQLMHELSKWIAEITGTHSVTLQPAAGAHGELTGCLIIRAFHHFNDEEDRIEMIVPDSSHGTNPSSAAMAGFKVLVIPSRNDGSVDLEALVSIVSEKTAGLMLTNPNTLGLFESEILEITRAVHDVGGLLYYDGANLNAILGKTRPGDMGFDVVHVNVHKTFATPHGGGGPGSGPVGVSEELDKFLPVPVIEFDGNEYSLNYDKPNSIGKVHGYFGNFGVLVKAYAYLLSMGPEGLERAAELAVLNANYLAHKISRIKGFSLTHEPTRPRKHEFVISCEELKNNTNIGAGEVVKRLMDFGIHPPTVYFPLIVTEALMIEPTETETLEELDRLVEVIRIISKEAYHDPSQ